MKRWLPSPFLSVAAVVLLSLIVGAQTYSERRRERMMEAEAQLTALRSGAEVRLVSTTLRLLSMANLMEARGTIDPVGFMAMYRRSALSTDAPVERAIAFMPEVTPAELPILRIALRDLRPRYDLVDYGAFEIFPTQETSVYFPVILAEPSEARANVFGFNMATSIRRLTAAQQALATGTPRVTHPVVLTQDAETGPSSFLILVPVALAQRWAGIDRGVLAASITPEQMFAAAESNQGSFQFLLRIGTPLSGVELTNPTSVARPSWLPMLALSPLAELPPIVIPGADVRIFAATFLVPTWTDFYFVAIPPLLILLLGTAVTLTLHRLARQRNRFADDLERRTDELRESEAQHARTQRLQALGRLVGGVAHDFNNNLSVIRGNLELTTGSTALDSEQRQYVDEALAATRRGASLARQLLAFGRESHLQPEAMHLSEAISGAISMLSRALPETIALRVDDQIDTWPVMVDKEGFENAVLNIAVNAQAAMPEGGELSMHASNIEVSEQASNVDSELDAGRYVLLEIRDTGCGMTEDGSKRAFEPFYTTKGPGDGSGLGLSSVYGFMTQSGGTARLQSTLGEGTTVQLYIPTPGQGQADQPQDNAAQPEQRPIEGRGAHILLVEDEAAVRRVLAMTLARQGYKVTPCESGDAALAWLESHPAPDLVLTDIVMPGDTQGPELLRAIRARDEALPVIMISGYPRDAIAETDADLDRSAILSKPISARDLVQAIESKLDA